MTWSVTSSGDVPAGQSQSFVNDVVGVFKKYGADVHAFFFQHPNGTVTDLNSVDVPPAAAASSSGTVQSGSGVAEAAPAATTEHPATGGRTVQAPASVGQDSPAPTPPTIDLANVSTAQPVSDSGAPAATVNSEQEARVSKLEGDVADIKDGLDKLMSFLTTQEKS